jgi:hypothetical protein
MEKGGWIAILAFTAVCIVALFFGIKCLLLTAAIDVITADQAIGYTMHITVDGQDTSIWFKTKKIVVNNEFALEDGKGSLYTHLSKGVILDIKPIQ